MTHPIDYKSSPEDILRSMNPHNINLSTLTLIKEIIGGIKNEPES